MADWHSIKVVFDEPVPPETLKFIEEEMEEEDYDFPLRCLQSTEWFRYRSPMGGGAFIVRVLLKHGARGQLWLTNRHDAYADEHCSDQDVEVFRPGVAVDSIAAAHRFRVEEECIQRDAKEYVKVARAFGVSPLPVIWEAAALVVYIHFTDANRPRFEAAVKQAVQPLPQPA